MAVQELSITPIVLIGLFLNFVITVLPTLKREVMGPLELPALPSEWTPRDEDMGITIDEVEMILDQFPLRRTGERHRPVLHRDAEPREAARLAPRLHDPPDFRPERRFR